MLSNCGEPAQCEVGQALCLKFLKWFYSPAEWLSKSGKGGSQVRADGSVGTAYTAYACRMMGLSLFFLGSIYGLDKSGGLP